MTTDELIELLFQKQDLRYKKKIKVMQPFYLFIKNKNQPRKVYYVRYTDNGRQFSTFETNYKKAYQFAINHLQDHENKEKSFTKKNEYSNYLINYYKKDSPHIEYCERHNRHISDKDRQYMANCMLKICELTPHIRRLKQLDKKTIVSVQERLLTRGWGDSPLSAKTVKNILIFWQRPYLELLDKSIIEHNPFSNLPTIKTEITKKWDCFSISNYKNKLPLFPTVYSSNDNNEFVFSIVTYLAIVTGTRKSELLNLSIDDVIFNTDNNTYWLRIAGTKTDNAYRVIPITELCYYVLLCFIKLQNSLILNYFLKSRDFNNNLLLFFGKLSNLNSLEEIKNTNYGNAKIVFHGFRKMFKTLLTAENLNKDLIEYSIGHGNKTSFSVVNNVSVNDTYLLLDRADFTEFNKILINAIKYLEPIDNNYTINFYKLLSSIIDVVIKNKDEKLIKDDYKEIIDYCINFVFEKMKN